MKKQYLCLLLFLCSLSLMAQITNSESIIVVEPNATLIIKGITNSATGRIINSGNIEVDGDFENTAMVSSGPDGAITFTGTSAANFTPGAQGDYSQINMAKSGANVNLLGDLSLSKGVDFTNGSSTKMNLGNFDLTLEKDAVVTAPNINRYFTTLGTGYLKKIFPTNTTAATFVFPVGDATRYTPLNSDFTGTVAYDGSIKVKVAASMPSVGLPSGTSDYIKRHWDVTASGISAYNNLLTGSYSLSDLSGNATLVKGASHDGTDWSYVDAAPGPKMVTGRVTADTTEFTGSNFYGKIDLSLFLQGPYHAAGDSMFTKLADAGLIPASSPYDASITASSIPANAVDWVEIQLRDELDPTVLLGATSAFLLSDGSVVATDGISLPSVKDAPTNAYLAIYHRNHLPIRTAISRDLVNTSNADLTIAGNVYDDAAILTNDPQKNLGSGKMALWAGDITQNDLVSYNGGGNDRTTILIKVGFTTPNNTVPGYFGEDVNMDGIVSYNGGGNDRTTILINVGFATPNGTLSAHID